jgi:predicted O-methyltransferase YrrM
VTGPAMASRPLPEPVALAAERAARAGFTLSCDPGTGRLLSVLAAAVPPGGRVLELGTGAGVGTAWITDGLSHRADWPGWVRLVTADALAFVPAAGQSDLIFADSRGGKWEGLALTVAALRPGGLLLVDDMTPRPDARHDEAAKLAEIRAELLLGPVQARVQGHFTSTRATSHTELLAALDSAQYGQLLSGLDQQLAEPPLSAQAVLPAGRPGRPRGFAK